jgi:hypothetical protein
MPKFLVQAGCSVKHGGRIYNEGETIEMDAKHVYPGLHVVPAGSPQGQVIKQQAGGGTSGEIASGDQSSPGVIPIDALKYEGVPTKVVEILHAAGLLSVESMLADSVYLTDIEGIGETTAQKILQSANVLIKKHRK